ncbi:MAG: efflux RND transporter permease subunit [Candidatus Eremiobacteraeota bacterium]|nr:efflux RND transporter permease subunit [Candidatus Eremiobacteraeota bacterium]
MKFSLTRLFIRRPTLVFVIIALMTFAGVLSTATIVKELYPDVSQPTVTVSVGYSGASVTEMRDNIVQPIEQNLAGTPDLQTLNAVVQQGEAQITAIFDITSDTATDLALTNKAIQAAEKYLPTNISPPTVNLRDPTQSVVVTLALYSKKLSLSRLAMYATNVIAPQMEQVPDISFVNVGGVVTPAYEVVVDPVRLAAANLTLNDVINTLQSDNQRVPGGFAYEPNRQTTIDIRGDIQTLDTVRNLAVVTAGGAGPATAATQTSTGAQVENYRGGLAALPGVVNPWTATNSVVRIGDVATVSEGYEPRLQYAHISGASGLFMQVQKAATGSEVDASNNILRALPQIERQFPEISFRVINIQSKFTGQQIAIVTRTLMAAILLTGIAMIFFLRSWRSAIVVCIAIPTSLAIAITVMKLMHLTIDTISLLGMSLVIGILVDDSTVVLENIERHYTELKADREEAAVRGREEIGAAAVVITLVDVVVFFPIAFIQGQVGRQIAEFAIVVVISTLTSLFVSFTITPTLAGLWALRSKWKPWPVVEWFGRKFDDTRAWYTERALPWSLAHGRLVALFCAGTFALALAMVGLGAVGEEFIPRVDRGELYVQLIYPIGTPIQTVQNGTFSLERKVLGTPDIFANTAVAGAYAASFGGFVSQSNVGQIHVWLKDERAHPTSYWVQQFQKLVDRNLPSGVQAVVVPATSTQGGNSQPIDFLVTDVTGGDPTPYAQQVFDLLRRVPGATSVNSTGTQLAPEVSIQFDRAKAQALGVDLGQAAQAAGAAFGGNQATQFETTSGLEQVQVIYPQSYQTTLDVLKSVAVRSSSGNLVYLSDIARFVSTPTAPLITRTDRNNVIHVDANYATNSSLSAVEHGLLKRLPSLHLPPNIVVRPAPLGQQDFMHQTLVGMGLSMIVSVILVYLLMVALYNSYVSPFIIIFSVPVAAIGAIGALFLTHQTLNLFSLIGTILLIGIATKNGILLVDYANTLRARGLDKLSAIMQSAHTRFRPIIMTSFSVMAGNLALALALDPGSASRSSLGIVVIGGVFSSLVLTLVLIPNVYVWLAPRDTGAREWASPRAWEFPPAGGREPVPETRYR